MAKRKTKKEKVVDLIPEQPEKISVLRINSESPTFLVLLYLSPFGVTTKL